MDAADRWPNAVSTWAASWLQCPTGRRRLIRCELAALSRAVATRRGRYLGRSGRCARLGVPQDGLSKQAADARAKALGPRIRKLWKAGLSARAMALELNVQDVPRHAAANGTRPALLEYCTGWKGSIAPRTAKNAARPICVPV